MDLGKSASPMYDNPTSGMSDKKFYPSLTLPLALIKGMKLEVGDKVSLDLTGKITSITQDEYSSDFRVEIEDGECEYPEAEAKEGE